MKPPKRGAAPRGSARKKAYRAPKLTVHGDIRKLTRAKAGTRGDGTGKPATRTTGTSA